jgi:outer membrane protein assembly factor BamB
MRVFPIVVLLALAAWIAVDRPTAAADQPPDWNQWRGPSRDGRTTGPAWPESLDADHLKRLWRVELGPSYSGPLVVGDLVYVTETKDRKRERVHALDRTTGKERWRTEWDGSLVVPFFAWRNGSWIRSTPAHDGERLYVAGIRDVLVCLDAAKGNELWRVDFVQRYGTPLPAFGFVSSPLVVGDALYVQAANSCVKLDKKTGKELWRTMKDGGGGYGSAFSSPVLATVAGKPQLLVQARERLAGVDPETGEVLWSKPIPAERGMNILTPIVHRDGLFTTAYGGKALRLDVAAKDGKFEVAETWDLKLQGYMTTPVVIDGHAYLLLRNRRACCIDLERGKATWTTDERFGEYWNLVSRGDRILALDQRGELLLFKANPQQFDLVDRRKISDEETWAHLAVVGDQLFVRELNAIAAYQWK